MSKAFFFDFDGVVVDSKNVKIESYRYVIQQDHKVWSKEIEQILPDQLWKNRKDVLRYIYYEFFKEKLSFDRLQSLNHHFTVSNVKGIIEKAPLIEGIPGLFTPIKNKGYAIYIVSLTDHVELEMILSQKKILPYITGFSGAPSLKADSIRAILQKDKLDYRMCYLIGDSKGDWEAANANHILFIPFSEDATIRSKELLGLNHIKPLKKLEKLLDIIV